jgi:hypothetical protein
MARRQDGGVRQSKLVPPAAVLIEGLSGLLDDRLHRQITEEILREARIDERVLPRCAGSRCLSVRICARSSAALSSSAPKHRGVLRSSGPPTVCSADRQNNDDRAELDAEAGCGAL